VRRIVRDISSVRTMMKRSMSEACSTTGGSNSRPTEVAKVPSRPAAKSSALARATLLGSTAATTVRAKAATSSLTDTGE